MAPPAYDYTADGTAGFENNDMVVVTQGSKCALAQITVGGDNSQLQHPAGTYNPANNGTLPLFSRDALVFNLGVTPVWRTYSIANNKLVATEVFAAGRRRRAGTGRRHRRPAGAVRQGHRYQRHGGRSQIVDTDDSAPTPQGAVEWQQVLAVRIAVLARSQNYEKPDPVAGLQCNDGGQPADVEQELQPRSVGDPFPALEAALATAGSQAGCYKYRVFETIVPLRNMIWR